MPTHIVIADEHAAQIRQLAEKLGITRAEAVGVLLKDAIAAGRIEDGVPGFEIVREGEAVTIEAVGKFVREMSRDQARQYSKAIRAAITPAADNPLMPAVDASRLTRDLLEANLAVARRGGSVKLRDPATGAEKTLAPSVAADVARLIDKAAADQ